MVSKKAIFWGVSAIATCAVIMPPALAQGEGPLTQEDIETIYVTATKRRLKIADVPISVSVQTGEDLEAVGAQSIQDVQFAFPSLSIVDFGPGTGLQIQIRGVSSNFGLPTTGLYLDEMPVNSDFVNANIDLELSDLQRIEVLRGPQGTLYGEGSMGGTIKYVTNAPKLNEFEGEVFAELRNVKDGNVDWRSRALLNIPVLEDKLALRALLTYGETAGYIDQLGDSNVNDSERFTARVSALLQATDRTSVNFSFMRGDVEVDNDGQSQAGRVSLRNIPAPGVQEYNILNLTLKHEFDFAELVSSTGYIDRFNSNVSELSATFVPLLEAPIPFGFGFPPGTVSAVGSMTMLEADIWTHETRLASTGQGPLQWTVGGYYRNAKNTQMAQSFTEPVPLGFDIFASDIEAKSEAWAIFGEASYTINDRITATVGGRYYEDSRDQTGLSTSFGVPAVDDNAAKFDSFNPRVSLLFKLTEQSSIFASASKGFRSGGFNLQSTVPGQDVALNFDPESLWTYEVGGVLDLSSANLLIQWAVYYNDWTDIQSLGAIAGSPFTITVNAGEASGLGIDFQADYTPTDNLSFGIAVGWNDLEYDTATADSLPGDPLDYVSPLTIAGNVAYQMPISDTLNATLRADVQYTDRFQIFLRNFLAEPVFSDDRVLIQLSAGITHDKWDAQLFVQNLLDEDAVIMPSFGALEQPFRTVPRQIGVRVTRRF